MTFTSGDDDAKGTKERRLGITTVSYRSHSQVAHFCIDRIYRTDRLLSRLFFAVLDGPSEHADFGYYRD